jgi:hypothetical protein
MVNKERFRVTIMSESQTKVIVFALNFGTNTFSNGPYKFQGKDFDYCHKTNQLFVYNPTHN